MPMGKGTYGSKKGRPKSKKNMTPAEKKKMLEKLKTLKKKKK